MLKQFKAITLILVSIIIFTAILPFGSGRKAEAKSSQMRNLKASDIAAEMGLGWNLGNTLDSYGIYDNTTNYRILGFYIDGTNYLWNLSPAVSFSIDDEGNSLSASITWDMSSIKSSDSSKTRTLGFQIWNFSDEVNAGTQIQVEVCKAEIKSGQKICKFPDLLGKHTLTLNRNGSVSFLTGKFDNALANSGQIKAGTFTLSVKLTPDFIETKQEYFETLWGNPVTSKALINKIKAAGFNAVRIPVTWYTNMDSSGNVEDAWMDRVEEVVNYVLDSGMYCIINMHHDTGQESGLGSGWLQADLSDPSMLKRYAKLWKQIADRFKDYNDYLLFESFNELIAKDSKGNYIWTTPDKAVIQAVNTLNQTYVDTVRATGGNNAARHLIVNTYGASTIQKILDGFVLPADTVKDHLIVEVHDYEPSEFSFNNVSWTKERNTWGTKEDKAAIDSIFKRLDKRFISKGIPVIVGEFGTSNKNNVTDRVKHAKYYVTAAQKKGIVCFWWDNGGKFCSTYKGMGLINRSTLKWEYPELLKAIAAPSHLDKSDMNNLSIAPIDPQTYSGKALTPELTIMSGTYTLTPGTDYTVTYINNVSPGKASVAISGMSTYYGSVEEAFVILPQKVKLKNVISNSAGTVMVRWEKCTGATGYQVLYSDQMNGNYTSAIVTSAASCILNKLSKGKTYYIKVRAFITIDQISYYGDYSTADSVKVN